MNVADTVGADFDRMICKQASQDRWPDPDEQEEAWKASVRAHAARRQEENRLAWCHYFSRLAGSLRAWAVEYAQRVALLGDRGEGVR